MIALQSDVRVYLACGYTDMRKGMQGLAMLVQQVLAEDPFNGAVRVPWPPRQSFEAGVA
jgi:transposase